MTDGSPDLTYDSLILTYIAKHPDASKYDIAKNVRTGSHPKGLPYSTVSLWIKQLEKRGEIVARKLGRTRAGLSKRGYSITPSALFWVAYALDADKLLDIVKQHERSLPIPARLIEEAIRSTGNAPMVIGAVTELRLQEGKSGFDDYFAGLVMETLWDLRFDDPDAQREFVEAVIRAAAEVNESLMEKHDFASSMLSIIEDESRYLANASRTLEIVKGSARKLE